MSPKNSLKKLSKINSLKCFLKKKFPLKIALKNFPLEKFSKKKFFNKKNFTKKKNPIYSKHLYTITTTMTSSLLKKIVCRILLDRTLIRKKIKISGILSYKRNFRKVVIFFVKMHKKIIIMCRPPRLII